MPDWNEEWIYYFPWIFVAIAVCRLHGQNARLKQTKGDRRNHIFVDTEGGYTLHRPGTKTCVGVAACGDSAIFKRWD